jgi:four helix bundle protein
MTHEEWLAQVSDSLKNDPIWKFEAYPKSLFLYDLAWEDTDKLLKDVRGRKLAGQLIDSAGSVSANIDEGFGRGIESGEYIQFLRYALGSARETRSWYYKSRRLLAAEAVRHRIALCDEIIALLVVTIKQRRARGRK